MSVNSPTSLNNTSVQNFFKCTEKIEREVCIISAIGLENNDMKDF
jgi:hypothetical protein